MTTEVRIRAESGDTCGFPDVEKAQKYLAWLLKHASMSEREGAFAWVKNAKIQTRQVSEWTNIDTTARKEAPHV